MTVRSSNWVTESAFVHTPNSARLAERHVFDLVQLRAVEIHLEARTRGDDSQCAPLAGRHLRFLPVRAAFSLYREIGALAVLAPCTTRRCSRARSPGRCSSCPRSGSATRAGGLIDAARHRFEPDREINIGGADILHHRQRKPSARAVGIDLRQVFICAFRLDDPFARRADLGGVTEVEAFRRLSDGSRPRSQLSASRHEP